jgi:hypothetical protein
MGARHGLLDPGRRPVFEVRNSKPIWAGLIPAYALDFYKYIRYLHDPAGLTESSFLTSLARRDVIELVSSSGLRPNIVDDLKQRSINTYNA